jgi:elongation factor G
MVPSLRNSVRQFQRCFHGCVRLYAETKLNDIPIDKIRNIGIIAHIDAGKTTTTERMLYFSGKTSRIGNVDEGDTVTDYLPSERQRGITIQSAAITIPWNNRKINIIDTPGHADFTFEVIRSLRVLDGAVTILDAVAGVEAQTEKVWKQADALNIPKIAFVNKMDRPGAGFSRTVKEIIQKLQTRVVLVNVPYFETSPSNDPIFAGVVDIIHKKLLRWNSDADSTGKTIEVVDIESKRDEFPELYEMVEKSRESMVETLGEFDESVIDAFLEHDEDCTKIPVSILNNAIRNATLANQVTPVLCGASFRNIGVQPLMDSVVNYLPSPLQINVPEISSSNRNNRFKSKKKPSLKQAENVEVAAELNTSKGLIINKNPSLTVSLAFKVMTHATKGIMIFFRVYSGKLLANSTVVNTRTGKKLQLKKLMIMYGDEPEEVKSIASGNIGVIIGNEDDIITGDTIVSHGVASKKNFSDLESNLKLLPIEIPPSLFNSGIEPSSAGDERYMNECIKTLIREDPSLTVSVDEDLGQTVLGGMGELHLDIVRERLVKDMKAKVRLREVAVSYKETLTGSSTPSIKAASEDKSVSVELELMAFEGPAVESTYAEEDGSLVFEQENNIIILEPGSTSEKIETAITERRWKSEHTLEELQDSVVQGCLTALQIGGPLFGLSLHSMAVRIKQWDFPVDLTEQSSAVLNNLVRQAISSFVQENDSSFGLLEPIMETKVYVNSDVLGEVSHDLTQRCHAIITSIEDESAQNLDTQAWANDEAEKVYLPPDYTMKSETHSDFKNKKIIIAETPLREMIGYLSRLRSLSQGRATFDMSYIGMRRATKARANSIAGEFHIA